MKTPIVSMLTISMAAAFFAGNASAFRHIVKPGETLAQIAGRVYGDPKLETVLVGANALDAQGGSVVVPGMRIEVPAPQHHRVDMGETWYDLALMFLGDKNRADVLARVANNGVAWIPPVEGQEIAIPAVLSHLCGENESITTVAERYGIPADRAWELNNYNNRSGERVKRGEIILVPFYRLELTEAGKSEAREATESARSEAGGETLELQRKAGSELPALLADVRYGRYAEAVARGNRLIGTGVLTRPQLATVHRALLESYVALDAPSAAAAACAGWRSNDPNPKLDPVLVSPKIIDACK